MSSTIRGVVPPLAIPLKDGELDVPSLERHINRMIDAGLDGLFVSGSTGEVAFSTAERRAQIQREAVRIVDGRVPLLVGVIDTETERVIENIKAVEEIGGATGVVATAPFYALGGETEVERHFRLLKENTSLELWAYDIPVCVHTKLSPDLLMRLGRDGVIDGVKDSSGDDVWRTRPPATRCSCSPATRSSLTAPTCPARTAPCPAWRTWTPRATCASGRPTRGATGRPCAPSRTASRTSCASSR